MGKKNKCPNCGNRMRCFKCHVCGFKHDEGSTIMIDDKNRKMKR